MTKQFRKTRLKRQRGAAGPDEEAAAAASAAASAASAASAAASAESFAEQARERAEQIAALYMQMDELSRINRERTVQPGTGPDSPRSVANPPEHNPPSHSGGKRKTRKAKKSRRSKKSKRKTRKSKNKKN